MATKKRGLGRGLDALLGSAGALEDIVNPQSEPGLRRIAVDLIKRGRYQPRVHFEPQSLQELADSIKAQGVVQPIVVRPLGDGHYELVAGERRWRASQLAGIDEIPAVVSDVDDKAAAAVSLIENIQRENLNPLEESRALQRLIEEFDMTHQQVAEAVGRSRASVTNLLRLHELNDDVKQRVETGALGMGHARALLALNGGEQSAAARLVEERGLSVRETERLVKKRLEPLPLTPKADVADPDIKRLEEDLGERLGANVKVDHHRNGKGKLIISYTCLDELDGILGRIK